MTPWVVCGTGGGPYRFGFGPSPVLEMTVTFFRWVVLGVGGGTLLSGGIVTHTDPEDDLRGCSSCGSGPFRLGLWSRSFPSGSRPRLRAETGRSLF